MFQRFNQIFLIIALLAIPTLLSDHYLMVLVLAGIYSIACIGLNLLMGYTGQISFGQNAFMAIGAYGSAILTTQLGWSPWVSLLATLVIAGGLAYVIAMPILRIRGHYLAMATAALGMVFYLLAVQLRSITGGYMGIAGIPPLSLGPLPLDTPTRLYYLTLAVAALLFVASFRITKSRVGRAIRAIRADEVAARCSGINVTLYKVQIFLLSAIYASIAGNIYVHSIGYISPETISLHVGILFVVMVIVGGTGTAWGGVVGALVLSFLPELLRTYKEYGALIYGMLLVLVLILAPRGICGYLTTMMGAILRVPRRLPEGNHPKH